VEKALESLERGGWVVRIKGSTSLRWSIVDHVVLADLFSPVPLTNTSFMALAEIVESLVSLDGLGSKSDRVRSAAARQLLVELRATADWGEVGLPIIPPNTDAWDATLSWVAGLPSTAL
jgi:hypothetical protein